MENDFFDEQFSTFNWFQLTTKHYFDHYIRMQQGKEITIYQNKTKNQNSRKGFPLTETIVFNLVCMKHMTLQKEDSNKHNIS